MRTLSSQLGRRGAGKGGNLVIFNGPTHSERFFKEVLVLEGFEMERIRACLLVVPSPLTPWSATPSVRDLSDSIALRRVHLVLNSAYISRQSGFFVEEIYAIYRFQYSPQVCGGSIDVILPTYTLQTSCIQSYKNS